MTARPAVDRHRLVLERPELAHSSAAVWTRDRLFNAPRVYDLAFGWELAPELRFLLRFAPAQAQQTPGRIFVPACGTGRYALALARAGLQVHAWDINPEMVEYAAQQRPHRGVRYAVADMAAPWDCAPGAFDGGYLLCNSLPYLLEQTEVQTHLEQALRALVPGGFYLLSLDLNLGPAQVGARTGWRIEYEGLSVTACWSLLEVRDERAVDRVVVSVSSGEREEHRIDERQPQRLWSCAELQALCESVGFRFEGVFHPDGTECCDRDRPGRYYVLLRRPPLATRIAAGTAPRSSSSGSPGTTSRAPSA